MRILSILLLLFLKTIVAYPQGGIPIIVKSNKQILEEVLPDSLKYGAINRANEVLVPFVYDHLTIYSDSLYAARKGNKWGFVNRRTGKKSSVFDLDFVDATPLSRYKDEKVSKINLRKAIRDSAEILLDVRGKELAISKKYDLIVINDSAFIVKKDGRTFLVNDRDEEILATAPSVREEGVMLLVNNTTYIYRTPNFEAASTLRYKSCPIPSHIRSSRFVDSISYLRQDGEERIVKEASNGWVIYYSKAVDDILKIEPIRLRSHEWDSRWENDAEYIEVSVGHKSVAYNVVARKQVTSPEYSQVSDSDDDFIYYNSGALDKKDYKFYPGTYFYKQSRVGQKKVKSKAHSGKEMVCLVNCEGVEISPYYDDVFSWSGNGSLLRLSLNQKYGVADTLGNIIVPVKFDDVFLADGYNSGLIHD